MSAMALEGYVEDGQIRLLANTALPDKAKVYVVVADPSPREARIWSPRLADPPQMEHSPWR